MPPVETSDTAGGSWAQLVSPRYRRLVAISSLLFVFQQFAGINAVVFFSTKARATRTGSTQRGAHAARGPHAPHATHCSAPAAHIARAAQSCLPRDQCLPPACRSLQTRASARRWSPPSSSPRATSAAPRAPDSSWTGTRTTLTTLPHPHRSCRARHSCHCCHFHQSCALYHSCRFCHPYHSSHS